MNKYDICILLILILNLVVFLYCEARFRELVKSIKLLSELDDHKGANIKFLFKKVAELDKEIQFQKITENAILRGRAKSIESVRNAKERNEQ